LLAAGEGVAVEMHLARAPKDLSLAILEFQTILAPHFSGNGEHIIILRMFIVIHQILSQMIPQR
jgi:hypothetical protein